MKIEILNNNSLRLAGVRHDYKTIEAKEIDELVEKFLNTPKGEKKHHFRDKITSLTSDIKNSKIKVIQDINGIKLGVWGGKINTNEVFISFIRTTNSKLSNTLFNQLINDLINLTISSAKNFLIINNEYLSELQKEQLESYGFLLKLNQWVKIVDKGVFNSKDYFDKNVITSKVLDNNIITKELLKNEVNYKLQMERLLFPLKFEDLDIPTYIIPIKPFWASQLFDYHTEGSLFGTKAELSWNRENVYYRSVKPVSEKVPARILWYTSSKTNNQNGRERSIIACSYLESVNIGKPKDLFNKFKHLGIYEWGDVYRLAKNDINTDIKALEFSDTEVFKHPVSLQRINEVLQKNERKKNTFPSPLKVNSKIFNEIYKLGTEDQINEQNNCLIHKTRIF
ncbi:hypothetical protein [Flavivirga eckloniae]|uniref:N-acetyltransferase n=1 Tax=Flavivirga eckloniae TaxID=1803846 RepID=A0A2K9PS70_9FLAO|nr:hypothetical protein [Flavivirga eckloniae]AUP79901.1 hypothetical protein C1H87_14795 [Flavivirga eckloniae]